MARNVIYYNNTDNQISLAGIANLAYTDVILCFLVTDASLNVYGDGGAFDSNTGNLLNPDDIQTLQNAGKNVLASFGGDSGTFPSSAWQRCAQNVDTVVNHIVAFVKNNGLNGVDIDYEDSNAFTTMRPYDGAGFLIALTKGLAQALPPGRNIITHAPQTSHWYPGYYQAAYQQIWQQAGNQIAWFNNQFYDNSDRDATSQLKVQTYHDIVNIPGGPPPQKLLVGVPLTSSVEGYISLDDMVQNVIAPLKAAYGAQFGGAMAWQFEFDQGGTWANGIGGAVANLFVLHQGKSQNGQLWCSSFNGTQWGPDTLVPNAGMSDSPSALAFPDGGISVFHQGYGLNGQLWYSYFNGTNWEPDKLVPNVGMSESPSAVAFPGGGISVFHQGENQNGQLWYSYWNGTNWEPDKQVPNVGMSGSPSAVALPGGGISVFHQGENQNGQLWYSYFNGTNWEPDKQVPNVGMSGSPSAVAFPGGGLSVFHQGGSQNGQLWYSFFDGGSWQGDTQVPNVGMSESPSAAALPGGRISVFYQGGGDSGQLFYSYFDGTNWSQNLVTNVGMSGTPGLCVVV